MKNSPKLCLTILLICCNVGFQVVYTDISISNTNNHSVHFKNDNETLNWKGVLTDDGHNNQVPTYPKGGLFRDILTIHSHVYILLINMVITFIHIIE